MRCAMVTLIGAILYAAHAQAASFDCGKAGTATEKLICSDGALSKADESLAAVFAQAVATTLDPQNLRADQRDWLGQRNKIADAAALQHSYASRIDQLRAAIVQWQNFDTDKPADALGHACFVPPEAPDDATCTVEAAGTVAGAASPILKFQKQTYTQDGSRIAAAVVVLRAGDTSNAPLHAIAVAYAEEAYYGDPVVQTTPFGPILLLPGNLDGTGNFDASPLFRYDTGKPADIDNVSWLRDLTHRLPMGLGAWKGIYPDYKTMTARTPLWQPSDANCCPTGGHATIALALAGNRLVIKDLTVVRGAAAPPPKADKADAGDRLCGKPVVFAVDAATFSSGPAADDPTARTTAETRGPPLIRKAFTALCAAKSLSPEDIGARMSRVRIAWAGGADSFNAYFSDETPGALQVEWDWSGTDVPADADIRAGLLCAFHPKDKRCADRGP